MRDLKTIWSSWSHDLKILLVLVLVNILLVLAVGLGQIPRSPGLLGSFSFLDLPFTELVEFQIIQPGQPPFRFLNQTGDNWVVVTDGFNELPARSSRVIDFLRTLDRIELLRIVSAEGGSNEFGFGSPGSSRIVGRFADNQVVELEFGLPSARGGELFLRLDSKPEVYGVSSAPGFFLSQGASYWTELRLWPRGLALEDVLGFRLNYQFFNTEVFLQDQLPNGSIRWIQTQGLHDEPTITEEERSRRARELLQTLLSWEFASIWPGDHSMNSIVPELQVGEFSVQATGSRTWEIALYDVGDTNYLLRITDQSGLVKLGEISRWRLNGF
jgi:hypothetical protein